MTHLLPRQIHHDYPAAVGSEGIYLIDPEGKCHIDLSW